MGATIDQSTNTPAPECLATVDSIRPGFGAAPGGSSDPGATLDHISRQPSSESSPNGPGLPNAAFSLEEGGANSGSAKSVKVPGYEIVGELGRGGMGVVYKARQVGLNRWVALKMVLAGAHATKHQLERFLTEAKAVADLQHPNIVQIYEIGRHEELPYFSLEFVDGGSLEAKVHRRPQPPRVAAHMVETLAHAMQYAHEHNIIHRDLKPANILLTSDGMPKITDFGLAKRLAEDSGQTKSGTLLGTPSYMAPEQARGEIQNVGALADVYTLGAILYELLTGRPPFHAPTVLETVKLVTNEEPLAPSRLQADVPRDLETICLKCLEKDMGKRYGSARLLADDLRRFLSDEPILARPVSNLERLTRWCRRNPRVAALVGTVGLLLILVAAGSVAFAFRISQEMAETERQKKIADQNAIAEKLAHDEADRNAEVALKNAEAARKAQDIAGQQAQVALETVYNVATTADEKLRTIAQLGPLRKELIELVMKQLDKISKDAVTSRKADRTMGIALQRMGKFYEQRGETQQEIVVIERSLEIFNRLMKEQPEEDWNKFDAAISHDYLAEIGRENWPDSDKIIAHHDQALEMRKSLLANVQTAEPDLFLRHRHLAISYINWARLALELGDPAKALDCALHAVEECKGAISLEPKNSHDRWELLSAAYDLQGQASFRRGQADEARRRLENSRLLREEWVQEKPLDAEAKQNLGRTLEALGDEELELRRYPEALDFYDKSLAIFNELLKGADVPEYQWFRANIDYHLGTLYEELHNEKAAQEHLNVCAKTREALLQSDPKNAQRKVELMLVYARLAKHREAAKLAQELIDFAPNHPGKLFAAACGLALCSSHSVSQSQSNSAEDQELRRGYADKALATLRQAIARGYKDIQSLQTNPDLDALRSSNGYNQILNLIAKR